MNVLRSNSSTKFSSFSNSINSPKLEHTALAKRAAAAAAAGSGYLVSAQEKYTRISSDEKTSTKQNTEENEKNVLNQARYQFVENESGDKEYLLDGDSRIRQGSVKELIRRFSSTDTTSCSSRSTTLSSSHPRSMINRHSMHNINRILRDAFTTERDEDAASAGSVEISPVPSPFESLSFVDYSDQYNNPASQNLQSIQTAPKTEGPNLQSRFATMNIQDSEETKLHIADAAAEAGSNLFKNSTCYSNDHNLGIAFPHLAKWAWRQGGTKSWSDSPRKMSGRFGFSTSSAPLRRYSDTAAMSEHNRFCQGAKDQDFRHFHTTMPGPVAIHERHSKQTHFGPIIRESMDSSSSTERDRMVSDRVCLIQEDQQLDSLQELQNMLRASFSPATISFQRLPSSAKNAVMSILSLTPDSVHEEQVPESMTISESKLDENQDISQHLHKSEIVCDEIEQKNACKNQESESLMKQFFSDQFKQSKVNSEESFDSREVETENQTIEPSLQSASVSTNFLVSDEINKMLPSNESKKRDHLTKDSQDTRENESSSQVTPSAILRFHDEDEKPSSLHSMSVKQTIAIFEKQSSQTSNSGLVKPGSFHRTLSPKQLDID